MKLLALCMVFLLLAVLAEADKECTFGQTKSEECNACMCNPGGQWACTMMKCRAKREASCTPGSEFAEHCNTCTCGRDGMSAYCTTDSCGEK